MAEDGYDELYGEIGRRIRRARESSDTSQEALADNVKLSRTSVVNIEKGRQRPPIHTLYSIARVLGVKPHDLLPEVRAGEASGLNGIPEDLEDFAAQILSRTEGRKEEDNAAKGTKGRGRKPS